MNYYKWQEIHKTNHARKKINNSEINNFAIDELADGQKMAWQELQKYCRAGELAKLLILAKTYDRASDTFRSHID